MLGWLLLLLVPAPAWAATDAVPGPTVLLAPALTLVLAARVRRVDVALGAGIVVACGVASGFDPIGFGQNLGRAIGSAAGFDPGAGWSWSSDHVVVTVFCLLVSALITLLGRTGATHALVGAFTPLVRGPRTASLAAWAGGLLVFFDDYASCLVVGNALQPICDRTGVSRAKLAWIVDATAAPVASAALISTWLGFQVGLLDDALAAHGATETGFGLFVRSLPHRFYAWFTVVFVGLVAATGRDFGPMWAAEAASRRSLPEGAATPATGSITGAALPLLALLAVTALTMGAQAHRALGTLDADLTSLLAASGPYRALTVGAVVALGLGAALARRTHPMEAVIAAMRDGIRAVGGAIVILYLAWTLSTAIGATRPAEWFVAIGAGNLDPGLLPVVTFALAAAASFATGTSWGTMAMLAPLVLPLALQAAPPGDPVVIGTVGALLAGATVGDHGSLISDTTLLSSVGSGCDLGVHVRTQLPYVLVVATIAGVCGHGAVALGSGAPLALALGVFVCAAVVLGVGRPVPGR